MPRALKVCSRPGCPHLTATGRCSDCARAADQARGTAAARGYDSTWRARRHAYLVRHPLCLRLHPTCTAMATVADHHPTSRRDLITAGCTDPDADHRIRPLCKPCHDIETARNQPGGWNAR